MSDNWRGGADLTTLRRRADLLHAVRGHFRATGAMEVDTPALGAAGVTDPAIHALTVTLPDGRRRWLQTSPEYAMKRLLAAGSGDIFQLAHAFRAGERGRMHLPEFTLLEWYRTGRDEHMLMDEIETLLCVTGLPGDGRRARRISYRDAMVQHAGLSPCDADANRLRDALVRHGVTPPEAADRPALTDLLMGAVVAPRLGHDAPCFVHDYPADQAALAQLNPGDPPTAARFELFVAGVELANGYRELTDADEQRRRFEADRRTRRASGLDVPPIDERLLAALTHGLPPCAGVALGLDRLLMLLTGRDRIDAVVPVWDDD